MRKKPPNVLLHTFILDKYIIVCTLDMYTQSLSDKVGRSITRLFYPHVILKVMTCIAAKGMYWYSRVGGKRIIVSSIYAGMMQTI